PATGVIDLQTQPGFSAVTSAAYDLDTSGHIVGVFETAAGGSHGFYYSITDGSFDDLGTLGGAASAALRIANGVVAGVADVSDTAWHAMRIQAGTGAPQDIGTLGGATSTAFDVNRFGQVVGGATLSDGDAHAFVF